GPGPGPLNDPEIRHTEYMVEMRDGVKLATSVYLPEGDGPWPVVVQRTPYNKEGGARSQARYTDAGYAFVIQDQRGRYRSQGVYQAHENEIDDGYDTVEWIARQRWSNGMVGISGTSAVGIAANLAAAADPPHLRAAYVTVAPRSNLYEARFINGLFKEADTGNWMRGQGVSEEEIDAYKKRVVEDQRWRETDLIFHRHNIDIPIYNVGGWYDLFSYGTVMNFQYLQNWGREGAKGNQKMLVAPVGHRALAGDLVYPNAPSGLGGLGDNPGDRPDEEIRWFDYWLKGVDNGIMDEPPVRYYQMSAAQEGDPSPLNEWRTASQWPPTEATRTPFYLRSDGSLSVEGPSDGNASLSYRFDPANPVPTLGGLNLTIDAGPMDQREVDERDDYLRFETEPLDEPVAIAGKIDLELCASTDGPDTDFMVKLVDVYPDGYEALVLDTGLRTRYRHGQRLVAVEMMEPGEPTKMTVDLWNSAITFEEGHRIAVHVTSSNYPRFDVNPNTGDPPGETIREPRVATNTIHVGEECSTAILLPVLSEPDLPEAVR
ncbi:MAG: CocE/NonD family hydrolase, partial [Longimicrobiales bacterium]|nr:CocE/NonD family hydrolase [Longimicrobiales bacterium]